MRVKKNLALIILNAVVFLVLCIALLKNGIWSGHDWLVHFQRMISLNEELNGKQFPPLFDYWTAGQFGYSWQLFYPPFSSFLFMLARLITPASAGSIIQMKVVFFMIFIISFVCAYYAAKREHNSKAAGYLCAILMISSGYFLTNIFIRFALGEIIAMAFMPLFLRGCSSLVGDRRDIWLIPFAALAIALANIPSIVVATLFFVLFFAFHAKKIATWENGRFFLVALICILALGAFYWMPLVYHLRYSAIFANSGKLFSYGDMFKFSSGVAENLFSLSSRYGVSNKGMYLSVGVVQLLIALSYFLYGRSIVAKRMLIIAFLFIVAATHLLPWHLIPDSFPVLKVMQFPWRLLSCAAVLIALYTSGMLARLLPQRPALVLSLAVLCILCMYSPVKKALTDRHTALDTIYLWDDYVNNSNAKPDNFSHLKANDFAYFANRNASIVNAMLVKGYPEMTVRARGEQLVALPYIMYAGYYLLVDGKKVIPTPLDSGLVGVRVADGEHQVRLAYNEFLVIIPLWISLLSLGVVAFFAIRRYRRDGQDNLQLRRTSLAYKNNPKASR